jgi:NitT/TauT family transport system substrate-binding protein
MKRLLSFLIILLLTACNQDTSNQKPLKIGISLWAGYAYAFITQEKELFKKHGVSAEFVFEKDYEEALHSYETGEVDGILLVMTDVIALNAKGIPTQAVFVTDYSEKGDVIIGRPELDSLSDLKGKTITFEGVGTFSHLFVFKSLEKAGVQEGEFKTANILATQTLDALESGRVDAAHTWEPLVTEAVNKGYKVLATAGDIPGIITSTLNFRTEIIEQRPQDVQAVVNAFIEARHFLETNPDEAIAIMAQAEGVSKDEMAQGVKNVHILTLDENVAAIQPDGVLHKSGEMIIDFFSKKGQFPTLPNLNTVINPQFIQAAKSP